MKKWLISLFAVVPLFLVGCHSDDSKHHEEATKSTESTDPASLEVVVDILTPEKLEVNKAVELQAKVTQANKAVDDAEVKFEVWESGYKDKGQMIEGKLDKDGVYKAEITFDHDGVYYMYAHTTARGMHTMPKQKLVVGNPDMSKVVEDNESDSMDMDMNMEQQDHDKNKSETHSSHNN